MIREILETWCKENDISLTDGQKEAFEIYFRLLTEWNQKMNLTAITEENDVIEKHFLDCLEEYTVIFDVKNVDAQLEEKLHRLRLFSRIPERYRSSEESLFLFSGGMTE